MATEDRTRHDRLRALLPRIYATAPATSALGLILEILADLLREADHALERALRDKWVATSTGDRGDPDEDNGAGGGEASGTVSTAAGEDDGLPVVDLGGAALPLELLGAAVDFVRQPWEVSHEAYRTRIRLLAPMLASGLATPRVLLAFALTSLHSEPCPVLERNEDATLGRGLPPGTLARCRVCHGGSVTPVDTACPFRDRTIMDATLIDNPRKRVTVSRRALDPAAGTSEGGPHSARLRVRSDSLFAARPEVVLRVPADAGDTPVIASFRSLVTGETVVVAWPLAAGAMLTVRAASPHDPATPRHLQRWIDRPPGEARAPARAWSVAGDTVTSLDQLVFVAQGPRFDDARFISEDQTVPEAPARFVGFVRRIDSPALPPGDNTWLYQPLDRAALADALAEHADDPEVQSAIAAAPAQPAETAVDVTLSWWIRSPSRFRLRIPRTPAVKAALACGAADYLRHMVDRVRPAGVQPIFDFAELPRREALAPEDALRALHVRVREPVAPEDRDGFDGVHVTLAEALDPTDQPGFHGRFDVTYFYISRFTATTVEAGTFNDSYFDNAWLVP